MANQASHQDKWERRVTWLTRAAFVLIAVLIISFFSFIPIVKRVWGDNHEMIAHYGEAYVMWHSLFDTLACFFIGLTVLMQFYDLRKREKQFEEQQFQSTFLPYLTLFQAQIEHMECGPRKGRQLLETWSEILATKNKTASTPAERCQKFEDLMEQYDRSVEHYIRHFEVVIRLVLNAHLTEADRAKYTALVRSLLSSDEKILLAAYCEFSLDRQFTDIVKGFGFLSASPALTASAK